MMHPRWSTIVAALLAGLLSLGVSACQDDELEDPGVGPGAEEDVDLGDPELGDPATGESDIGDPADPGSEVEGVED